MHITLAGSRKREIFLPGQACKSASTAQFQIPFIMTTSCLVSNFRLTRRPVEASRACGYSKLGTSAFSHLRLTKCLVLTHLVLPDSRVDAAAMVQSHWPILASFKALQTTKLPQQL